MEKRYCLRLPSEIARGIPLREIPSEEEAQENDEDFYDEDLTISCLLLAARNGDEDAKEELKEFLGSE